MNIVDYVILAIIAISTIIGLYNGLVISLLNIGSFFLSWIGAFVFYPLMSRFFVNHTSLMDKLIFYTNGASKIPSIEERTLEVASLTGDQVANIVESAQLPPPFDELISSNLLNDSFDHLSNVKSIGQYFDVTIANIIVNILSFLAVFFIIRLAFFIIVSIANNVTTLPVLKQFDRLLGAGFGAIRGILILFVVFALVPIFMTLAPVDFLSEYLDQSLFAPLFYDHNIFTGLVKGII